MREALEQLQPVRQHKRAGEEEQARASTSEPEARILKTGPGGYAPNCNVQVLTAAANKVVVDGEATQAAGDQHQLEPALARAAALGAGSAQVIVDGGYGTADHLA